ncbi:uncharacterized protein LOC133778607 [Humulus lupulus]|uniref:uncharacterized protein LOC133778607 n=1 Tax=Humulus lupulus TaxID=3486 RepID=UPI002B4166C4|nr:uncharacterized protein LOC133778607 [Humulus lupulus]
MNKRNLVKIIFCKKKVSFYRLGLYKVKSSFMDDGLGKIKIIPDHFTPSESSLESPQSSPSPSSILRPRIDSSLRSHSRLSTRRRFRSAAYMLNLFSLRGLPWSSDADGEKKVELTAAELESLRSELAEIEEREAHLKAQLEHVDEVLRSARLTGYLYIRTRWEALPGEPPIDDFEVDDWLPRFVVLHGVCLFFYLYSTDLSPQDSTLLSDVIKIGSLPSFVREGEGTVYAFYILSRQGLRIECSSSSKIKVDSWLLELQKDCKVDFDTEPPNEISDGKK